MPEIQQMFRRYMKYVLNFLVLLIVGWGVTPYKSIFSGLLLGTIISTFNIWLLMKKTSDLGETTKYGGTKIKTLGSLTRMAAAALAVFLALEYPQDIHIPSLAIGLMAMYFVIMIDFAVQSLFTMKKEKR